MAFKHLAGPPFSVLKPGFKPWARDARYHAKDIVFLAAVLSEPPHYVPVGELDAENAVLVARGVNPERVQTNTLVAWNFLSTALKSKSDIITLHRCSSPWKAWYALLRLYDGPQTGWGQFRYIPTP